MVYTLLRIFPAAVKTGSLYIFVFLQNIYLRNSFSFLTRRDGMLLLCLRLGPLCDDIGSILYRQMRGLKGLFCREMK